MDVFHVLGGLSEVSVLLPIVVSMYRYSMLNKAFRVFLLFLLLHLVFNIITWFTALNGIHNLPFYHGFTVIEFSFYSFIYSTIAKKPNYKKGILFTAVLFVAVCILNAIFFENIHTDYNSNTRTIGSLILMGYAISYFYRMLKELTVETVEEVDLFWFNTAVLIYFSGTFFLSLFLKIFMNATGRSEIFDDFVYNLYNVHHVLYIVLNILLAKAIWVSQQNK